MADRPAAVEKAGLEHISDGERHGSPGRVFTLWFGANLTVADFVVGWLVVQPGIGLSVQQAIPVLLLGNVLAGLVLGLSAAMGPKLGYPQMMSSRGSFGRRGNYLFGGLNWISTIGWFTVNTILGVEALQVVYPPLNFFAAAAALVAIQVLVAVYGHDFIHLFEKWMSVLLGVLFALVFVLALNYRTGGPSVPSAPGWLPPLAPAGIALAVVFSYLMSWSPYASDYSRYLPSSSPGRRVALYAMAGGALASFGVEVVGAFVGSSTQGVSYFQGLYALSGWLGPVSILAIVLGVFAANALNLYTNSLSALVLDVKAKRWVTVVAGGVVGALLSFAGQENFAANFENFLLVLDYWIMPWLGVVLVDYFVLRTTDVGRVANPLGWDWKALVAYFAAVLISVPYMVPALNLGYPFGSLAYLFGGADFSYFISFGLACLLTVALRMTGRGSVPPARLTA